MPRTHQLHAASWSNVLGTLPPVLRITSGDSVVTRTLDAHGFDAAGERRAGEPNPMNGPVHVEGAEPGDALCVEILRIDPVSRQGWTRAALAANVVEPEHVRTLPPRERADWRIDAQARTVRLAAPTPALAGFVLPWRPMIGCFGVAPGGGQATSTETCGPYGGNMDYRGFTTGCRVSFPVSVPGALFFLGDCHASQGDGEIAGTGVETCAEVEVRLSVEKARGLAGPRGEAGGRIFTVGNARPLEAALQSATSAMVAWLKSDYGLSEVETAHLLGQVVRYEVGNVFNPAFTVVCSVETEWLAMLPGRG